MKFNVQSIHFDADQKLLDFVDQKVSRLEHFFDHIIEGDVFLKLDKDGSHKNKVSEIKLKLPGIVLFAKERCATFEEATDHAVEAIRKQLDKYKAKLKEVH